MKSITVTLSEKEFVGIRTSLAIVDYMIAAAHGNEEIEWLQKYSPESVYLLQTIFEHWGSGYWKSFRGRLTQLSDDTGFSDNEPPEWYFEYNPEEEK